jgi:putrescine transport system substrate-binding protein
VLNVYNYSDYIAEDTVPTFEKATGIKVTYDVFDSDEMVETKLLAGQRLRRGGADAEFLRPPDPGRRVPQAGQVEDPQPGQPRPGGDEAHRHPGPGQRRRAVHGGHHGIGYNVDKLKAAFGSTEIANSWDLVFKPENIAKLKDCGVTFLDTPSD